MIREEVETVVRDLLESKLDDVVDRLGDETRDHDNRYLTTDQAATVAGVCAETIRDWVQRGLLPERRAGRLLRVRLSDLHACMAAMARERAAPIDLDAKATEILRRRQRRKAT